MSLGARAWTMSWLGWTGKLRLGCRRRRQAKRRCGMRSCLWMIVVFLQLAPEDFGYRSVQVAPWLGKGRFSFVRVLCFVGEL
jgi:hypothetical protein